MHGSTTTKRRRALALGVLTAGFLALTLGTAGTATAAYKAKVDAGTLKVTGDGAADKLLLRLSPASPTILELDVGADGTADLSFDHSAFTAIAVDAGGGDDLVRVDQSGGAFADEALTIDGGDGADTLFGGAGAETFLGGKGNDFVQGGDANDRVLLGDGDDTARWNPGDDSDTIEGQNGVDLLDFFGAIIGETIGVSANGSRVRFTRDIASISMDLNDVERVGFHAFGGADTITVDNLAGTDAKTVALDLSASGGGGDGSADSVTVRGTGGADRVTLGSAGTDLQVTGLAAQVQVAGGEALLDHVGVTTLGGADTIAAGAGLTASAIVDVDGGDDGDSVRYTGTADADTIQIAANGTAVATATPTSTLFNSTAVEALTVLGLGGGDTIAGVGNLATLTALTIDGGDDNDTLSGGNGADLLLGGRGEDVVDGNQGADSALLGDGDDRFEWDPGDGTDTVDGQAGSDVLDFFGSNIGETIAVVANGGRARLTRDIGNVTMDFDNVERLAVHARGGADVILVDDLSGTDVTATDLDLSPSVGGGDTEADTILVNGTNKRDVVSIARSGSELAVSGLRATPRITGSEGAFDTLFLQTLGGDDDVTVAPTIADLIAPVVNLGADE